MMFGRSARGKICVWSYIFKLEEENRVWIIIKKKYRFLRTKGKGQYFGKMNGWEKHPLC